MACVFCRIVERDYPADIVHEDDEIIFQDKALFKIASHWLFDERQIQNIIKASHAQIVTVSRDFFVLAKTGRRYEIENMYHQLEPYGIMQFVRSGRIAVSKEVMPIRELLDEIEQKEYL